MRPRRRRPGWVKADAENVLRELPESSPVFNALMHAVKVNVRRPAACRALSFFGVPGC